MFILEFNTSTFSFYDFSQNILLSPLVNRHLHIILTETNYVIYDNESRIVFDVGTVTKGDWIKILEPTFVHVIHDNVWSKDDNMSSLKMTLETFKALIYTNNIEENFHQYFIGKINGIISEINSKFISIKNFKKKIEIISKNYFEKNDENNLENTSIIKSGLFLNQTVVNGDWNLDNTDAWYLAWSLDLIDNVSYDTINIGDIEFVNDHEVKLHPRARVLESFVQNKYNLITKILCGKDTYHFNKSGIEYKINLNDIS